MPETKKIVRSEPFVINKNMGSPMAISARDLTPTNADGLPVVLPTEKQKYDFDRNGWLLIPGVLSKDECDEMRTFAERLAKDPESIPEHERCPLGGPLQKLADHPVVVGFMNEFVAYPPLANDDRYGFRLETSHLFYRDAETPGKFSPHNGNGLFRMPWDSHFYRCIPGKAWSGLTRVVWEFNPVKKGQGGTFFVPGSHKAAYPAPETVRDPDSTMWETYGCPPGSLLFFTEAITHSANPWTNTENHRLAVFNLYNIVASRWHSWLPPEKLIESMPPLRQTLFSEPYNEKVDTFFPRTTAYMDG